MSTANSSGGGDAPWRSDTAPCVYCGRTIPRETDRCPHCRTSFSVAVRRASREVVGDWFYLDPRNPSGRGVTFETLVKMIEKGRLRPDSIVRGPTTHQDWMYAAEAPRLAKYLGLCPHCFAEASPEQTWCTHCQLNMNERPGGVRPGIPEDLVKAPFHQGAWDLEKKLAEEPATEAMADEPADRTPTPAPVAVGAAAIAAGAPAGPRSRAAAPVQRQRPRPKIWVIIALTWATVIPLFILGVFTSVPLWFLPSGCEPSVERFQTTWKGFLGMGPAEDPNAGPGTQPAPPAQATALQQWVDQRLADADRAERMGDLGQAIAVYRELHKRTGDGVYLTRVQRLEDRVAEQRNQRLADLKQRVDAAKEMVDQDKFDAALTVLRNIGADDRKLLESLNFSVTKMEEDVKRRQQAKAVAAEAQRRQLDAMLQQAAALRSEGKLQEAVGAYQHILAVFPGDLIASRMNIDQTLRDLREQIRNQQAAKPPEPVLTEAETLQKVADLMEEAVRLDSEEKFEEALARLEAIKKFDQKYWPQTLDERIREVKRKLDALNFFGVN